MLILQSSIAQNPQRKMRITTLLATTAAYAAVRGDSAASAPWSATALHRNLAATHVQSCSLETGVDYVANDIANAPATEASDCCGKCNAQAGCGAFTWTNWNGGTCWLKSFKGSTVAKEGAQSAVVSSFASGESCSTIEAGVDYVSNDIANVQAAAASDCCAKCSQHAGCGAFSWTNWNGGTCWLKSSKGATTANANAFSAVVLPTGLATPAPTPAPAGVCSGVEHDIDYPGSDIGNVPGVGASDCCTKCTPRSGCGAFTWTNYNGGTCWLKSGKGSPQTLSGAVSGVITVSPNLNPTVTSAAPTPAPACPVVEENVDYPGLDIANVTGSGAADCCSKCGQRAGCGAFTWTIHNGGTCWLKSEKGSPQPLSGAVSGVVANSGMTTLAPMLPNGLTTPVELLRGGYSRMRAVNLGGWLVAENWMSLSSPAWTDAGDAADKGEYIAMQRLGKDEGTRQFEQHRATWITENDIQAIAAAGLNSVRVPVGFWIVNDDPSTVASDISRVYAPGALKYLDKLVNEWAVKHNLAVMLSLHAHQGSQNGYDHSAPQTFGAITWSDSQANVDNSLQFATYLADRYKNSAAFLGMNLMNEPMFPTNLDVVQAYYLEAYKRIRATGNNCILVTSPPLWNQTPPTMKDFMRTSEFTNVWHEFHTYYRWTHEGKTEAQILDTAKPYRTMVIDPWTGNKLHVGEWSLTGPDSAPFQDKELLRQFGAIQMTNYAAAPAGWSFWSWRHDEEVTKISGWSLRQLLREGILTIPSGEVSAR
jgi:glucan 1,3-beta-glucosidase